MQNLSATVHTLSVATQWRLNQGTQQWDLYWVSYSHPLRAAAEQFIKSQFQHHFSAHIDHLQPYLLVMLDPQGVIEAAVGFNFNPAKGFFLDQYLDQPIHQLIAGEEGTAVQLGEVVEVGNLSIVNKNNLLSLMFGIGEVLSSMGFRFLVCTGTNSIVKYLRLLQVQPVVIGAANADQLSEAQRSNWGSYYSHRPQVMYGNLTLIWAQLKLQGLLAEFQLHAQDPMENL